MDERQLHDVRRSVGGPSGKRDGQFYAPWGLAAALALIVIVFVFVCYVIIVHVPEGHNVEKVSAQGYDVLGLSEDGSAIVNENCTAVRYAVASDGTVLKSSRIIMFEDNQRFVDQLINSGCR